MEVKAGNKHIDIKIYGSITSSYWEETKQPNNIRNVNDLENILNSNNDVDTINVYINSSGGSVFEGLAIYNILKRHKAHKKIVIDGFACSIASVIAMAGNEVVMSKSSLMMIHNAWTVAIGNAKELRKVADDLDVINGTIVNAYLTKINCQEDELKNLMDNEKYLSADECLNYGLCGEITNDTEETQANVTNSLNNIMTMYSNKLKELETIKNSTVGIFKIKDNGEEITKPLNNDENISKAKAEVKGTQENALKRFFNLLERGE